MLIFCAISPQESAAGQTIAADRSSAIILAYHRIGEDRYPETNLRKQQFEQHINQIIHGSYNVLPLPKIVQAIKNNEQLPPRTIAITFEGGYKSILKYALPLLNANNLPYTIFYASDLADGNFNQYLNWEDLKNLNKNENVTLGILPSTYQRLSNNSREEILQTINKASLRYKENFKARPMLFSFPFGEYNARYKDIIKEREFDASFGLQSGALHTGSDLYAIPRFTMTERYGDEERFNLVTNALPLPIISQSPNAPLEDKPPSTIKFTASNDIKNDLNKMSCFISGQAKPAIEISKDTNIELHLAAPIQTARTRVNCTLPGPENEDGIRQWRWFGMLLINNDVKKEMKTPY